MLYDPKEVLRICERTIGEHGLTEVAQMLIEEGNWADSCRAAIIPFMECAETALPQLAKRVIKLEAENAKLLEQNAIEGHFALVEENRKMRAVMDNLMIALALAGYGGEE